MGLWAFVKARFSRKPSDPDAALIAIMKETLAALEERITQRGWAVQYVSSEDPRDIEFGYTVGLSARGLPELLVTGVPQSAAEHILDRVATELVLTKNPQPRVIENVIENYSAELRYIYAEEFFTKAIFAEIWSTLNGVERCGGMQIVLPNPDGSFPSA